MIYLFSIIGKRTSN